jgi:hypothetical protein
MHKAHVQSDGERQVHEMHIQFSQMKVRAHRMASTAWLGDLSCRRDLPNVADAYVRQAEAMVTEQQVLRFREHIVPDLERQVCDLSERLSNLRQANADELSAMHERTDRAELLVAETAESLSAAKKRIALLDDMRRQAEEKAAEAEQKAQMRATEANTLIAQLRQAEEDGTARLNGVKAMLETKSTELQMALSTMCQMQQTHQAEVRQPCASCPVPPQWHSLLGGRRSAGCHSAACVRSIRGGCRCIH